MEINAERIKKDYEKVEEFLQEILEINDYEGMFPKKFDLIVDDNYDTPGYYILKINVMNKKEVEISIYVDDSVCVVNEDTEEKYCGFDVNTRFIIELIYKLV